MIRKSHILYLFILFIYSISLKANNEVERGIFDHYTTDNGLISNRIYSLAQDEKGFIWAATDFGLERFDGTLFKHHRKIDYKQDREDYIITGVLSNGNIIGGSYAGAFVEYDTKADTMKSMIPEEFNKSYYKEITGVYTSKDNRRYCLTSSGIYQYDEKSDSYSEKNLLFEATKELYICSIHIDNKERYWIGSFDSLFVLNSNFEIIKTYKSKGDSYSFIKVNQMIDNNRLMIITQAPEIWIFDTSKDSITKEYDIKTPFRCVIKAFKDKNGRYWFATDGCGLWYSDNLLDKTPTFTNLVPFNATEDEVKKIYSMVEDKDGNIWIGTQNSGIWCYRGVNNSGVYTSSYFGFPSVVCSSFVEDDEGNIIVSVDGGGLYKIDKEHKYKTIATFPNNGISAIDKAKDGNIYVVTWGAGVYKYNCQTQKVEKEEFKGINNPCAFHFGIKIINGTDIFICTAGDGYYSKKYNEQTWEKTVLLDTVYNVKNKWICDVHKHEPTNKYWILSTNNLWYICDNDTITTCSDVKSVKKTNPFLVFDVACNDDGSIFAATNEGISRFSADGKEREDLDFTPKHNYNNIIRDNNGEFWAAGDGGIIKFNYNKKSFDKLPGQYTDIATFTFYHRSSYKDSEGKIYFGTNSGYVCIDPNRLSFDKKIEDFCFANLYINNKKIGINEKPLNGSNLSEKNTLTLPYGETNINITIDATDFADIDKVNYKYKLEGLQNEWQIVDKDRVLKFSYIPPGKYKLKVIAYRTNKQCEEKSISINLEILNPWWKTWWFSLLSVLFLTSIIVFTFFIKNRNLIQKKNELNKLVALKTIDLQNALNDKDNIISVLGHDLKNPLFAIIVALENLINKDGSISQSERLNITTEVLDAAKTLQNEMLKLLDWAKSKKDELICKPQEINVKKIINEVVKLTDGMLSRKNITLKTEINIQHNAYADDRMISAVIRNLLNNAVKFTAFGGKISIIVEENENQIYISVHDTGIGMSSDIIETILNNDTISSTKGTNNEVGTGLGLKFCKKYIKLNKGSLNIKSETGKGTCITFNIPISETNVSNTITESNTDMNSKTKGPNLSYDLIKNKIVMIVDDNPLICKNIKNSLSDKCELFIAYDGIQALNIIENNHIDLILSDVDMPIMNGIELCKKVQGNELYSHIPFIFISGRDSEQEKFVGLSNGAIDYITKPFNQNELIAKIISLFKLRQKEHEFILSQLMQRENKSTDKVEENVCNPFANKFMDIIRKRYSEQDLNVEILANEMCVSYTTLFRRLKDIVGKSPNELLSEYRLNEAKRLLEETPTISVVEVAFAVGFSDASYFSKRYKAYFGQSPKQNK